MDLIEAYQDVSDEFIEKMNEELIDRSGDES